MSNSFEYQVCEVKDDRVTFVNGMWQGDRPLEDEERPAESLESCPKVWEYLARAGSEGWELVSAVASFRTVEATGLLSLLPGGPAYAFFDTLYLKRSAPWESQEVVATA